MFSIGADVVIENFKSGALNRMGLGRDSIKEHNPRLIYCYITRFGDLGPCAKRPGYDTVRAHSSLNYKPPAPEALQWPAAQPGPDSPANPSIEVKAYDALGPGPIKLLA